MVLHYFNIYIFCTFLDNLLVLYNVNTYSKLNRSRDFYAPAAKSRGGVILIYPLSVRPDIDTWFVRLSPPTVLELQL